MVSEHVADVPLVVDEVGSSVRVELLAEGAYARLENAGTWKVGEFPHVAKDSLGREHSTCIPHEVAEQFKLSFP